MKVRRYFFTMISVSVILVLLSATHVLTQLRSIKMAVGLSLAPFVRMSDLRGKHLIAFQDATIYLGEEFTAAAKASQYEEVATQADQVLALYAGRADVIVLDKNIFLYYCDKVTEQVDVT